MSKELPGTITEPKYTSRENFRMEVLVDGELQHWRRDRHQAWMEAVEADEALTIEEYVVPKIVPEEVTAYQARIALLSGGHLDAVEALMADAATDRAAKIAWEYGTTVLRSSPLIAALAPGLGLTEDQLDDLFIAAAQVE